MTFTWRTVPTLWVESTSLVPGSLASIPLVVKKAQKHNNEKLGQREFYQPTDILFFLFAHHPPPFLCSLFLCLLGAQALEPGCLGLISGSSTCVTLGRLLTLSVPQVPHL